MKDSNLSDIPDLVSGESKRESSRTLETVIPGESAGTYDKIKHLNRIIAVTSNINKTIVRVRNLAEIYSETCRIAIEIGNFKIAWIGVVDECTGKLVPVAWQNVSRELLSALCGEVSDTLDTPCLAYKVLSTKKYLINNSFDISDPLLFKQKNTYGFSWGSAAMFPLIVDENVKGVISFYTDEVQFFDKQEITLLEELALDVSFAVEFWEKEEKRKGVEEKYRNIVKYAPVGIYQATIDGTIITANSRLAEILGYESANELLYKKLKTDVYLNPDDRDCLLSLITGAESVNEHEIRWKRKDGTPLWIQLTVNAVKNESGETIYFDGFVRDITARKKAEEEVVRLSYAVQQSPASIVITNADGVIEYVNAKFETITGFTVQEAIGQKPNILKSNRMAPAVYDELWKTISSGHTWKGELINKKKDGEFYWESATISPLFDKQGVITGYIAVKEDLTELKKTSQNLRYAKEAAEEMNRLKSSFLANMSHELRTPMIGILGYSEILKEEARDEKTEKIAQVINKSGRRLLDTLNMILDFSLIESSKLDVELTRVNIIQILNEMYGAFEESAKQKKLSLHFDSKVQKLELFLDNRMFREIVNNLMNNAVKYTNKGGISLEVSVERINASDFAVIKIKDTGIGIVQENYDLIWEDFRQVSEGRGRSFEGTGLGLSITRKFVEKLHGEILVESKVGEGSVFTLRFPIR